MARRAPACWSDLCQTRGITASEAPTTVSSVLAQHQRDRRFRSGPSERAQVALPRQPIRSERDAEGDQERSERTAGYPHASDAFRQLAAEHATRNLAPKQGG